MVTLEEIKEAHSKYENLLRKETLDKTSHLQEQIGDLRSQLSGLESQVRSLEEQPKKEYKSKIAPLAQAYAAQLQDKYKDAPNSVTPEDFVMLSYGVMKVIKSPELVTNFKETLDFLAKKLAEEGELELSLEVHHSYAPAKMYRGTLLRERDAYSIEEIHTTSLPNISITFSIADLQHVYLDLGKHKVKSIWKSRSGYSNLLEREEPVLVPLRCLADRPHFVDVAPFGGSGYAKCELRITKRKEGEEKAEMIFRYPSQEAIAKGQEYFEESMKMRRRICETEFEQEEKAGEGSSKAE